VVQVEQTVVDIMLLLLIQEVEVEVLVVMQEVQEDLDHLV
jgi:hypothetical protein